MKLAQVLTAIGAGLAAAYDGAQVVYGGRDGTTQLKGNTYFLGDARGAIEALAMAPDQYTASTTYDLDIVCSTSIGGTDQSTAMQQSVAMFEAAITWLLNAAGNLGLAGVLDVQPIGSWRLTNVPSREGRDSAVIFTVRVTEDYT